MSGATRESGQRGSRGQDGAASLGREAKEPGLLGVAAANVGGALLQRKVARRLAQRKAAAPKKSATPTEVKAIQALIDQAIAAEQIAAAIEAETRALRDAKDARAADKERAAFVKRKEAGGLKQQAVNLAVAAYGIDITHVKSLLYSDSDTDSETDDEGRVTIGKGAFTDPGCLASTIAHESEVHVNQQLAKGRNYDGQQGRALNEVQAYDWEISNAPRFGLTKDQVAGLRRNRAHYMQFIDAKHQQRRQHGDYTMEKGHEDE